MLIVLRYTLNKARESAFYIVTDLPDNTTNKPTPSDAYEGQSKDVIDNCVVANKLKVQLIPAEIAAPLKFRDYGVILAERNQLKGDMKKSVTNLHDVENAASDGHPQLPFLPNRIGAMLLIRFENVGNIEDVIEEISLQRKGVQLTPEGHPFRQEYLVDTLAEITEEILFNQAEVRHTPADDPDMPGCLADLGTSLLDRFKLTGELTDISEAILSLRKAVQHTPEDHPDRPKYLANLGLALQGQFQHNGELTDISEAISFLQKAAQLTPGSNRNMPNYLADLGSALQNRFTHTRELIDISEAISSLQKAVQLTPESHPSRPKYLATLGSALRHRFLHNRELTDISEAISFQQTAVQLIPVGHPYRPQYLSSLGIALQNRFSHTGELIDISAAISSLQKAAQLTPKNHPDRPRYLANLGSALQRRFSRTGELIDIYEAISFLQKAVQLTPKSHPDMSSFLISLGWSHHEQFTYTADIADIHMAISNLSLAANIIPGSPSVRLNAAKGWMELSKKYDETQLLDAHRTSIHLISRIAGLEQTIEKRHNNLIEISTLSTSAAAVAFASGETGLALEWLEQGRCLVWSQLNDLRTPFDTLQSYDPEIANELMSVSRALENAGNRAEPSISIVESSMLQKSSLQDEMATQARLAQRWDQLLAKVRNIPDFEDFLRPPSSSYLLRNLPNSGIVIVINIHRDRCDALALRSGIEPLHIALPEFSYNKADNLRTDMKNRLLAAGFRMRESKPDDPRGTRPLGPGHGTSLQQILATLWILVVKPILNGLGYSVSILTNSSKTKPS